MPSKHRIDKPNPSTKPKSKPTKKQFFSNLTQVQEPVLHDSRISKSPKQKGFFGFISSIFWSDYLWVIVAFSTLVVSLMFYLIFLQPLILNRYIDTQLATVDKVSSLAKDRVNKVKLLSTSLSQKTTSQPAMHCTEDYKYTSDQDDSANIRSLSDISALPNDLSTPSRFAIFNDSKTDSTFFTYTNSVKTELEKLEQDSKNLSQYVDVAKYKNSWLEFCMNIKKSQGSLELLNTACNKLQQSNSFYAKSLSKTIISGIKTTLDEVNEICLLIANTETNQFPQYNKLVLDSLTWVETISTSSQSNQLTFDDPLKTISALTDEVKSALKEDQIQRSEPAGIWYLIGINLR
jgi:hypothetical protein